VGIGDNTIRGHIFEMYRQRIAFVNLIHPNAIISASSMKSIENSTGIIAGPGVVVSHGCEFGNGVILGANSTVGHDSVLDGFSHVAPGAVISGNVHLGSNGFVGSGAIVNPGSHDRKMLVGAGATIGSGAVVTAPCAAGGVYVGVPAKPLHVD